MTDRALRDLDSIYQRIEAETSARAARWFGGIEKALLSLKTRPKRAPAAPEDPALRHLLYGKRPNVYRIIYEIDEKTSTVNVLHIRARGRDSMPRR